jgi:hypothetical protein
MVTGWRMGGDSNADYAGTMKATYYKVVNLALLGAVLVIGRSKCIGMASSKFY